jgi:hypothetical protein
MSESEYKPHRAAVRGIHGMFKAIVKPKRKKEKTQ